MYARMFMQIHVVSFSIADIKIDELFEWHQDYCFHALQNSPRYGCVQGLWVMPYFGQGQASIFIGIEACLCPTFGFAFWRLKQS